MGADEVGTLQDLTQRRAILDRLIAAHRGRIANTAGDSVLAEFGSAVDAVRCAVDAQEALAEANAGALPDRRINFRIGIHVGDVMVKGGDLFGDGVNIAARLQTLANAGDVCISAAAHDQVRKILPLAFTDLGAQQVKNIEEPVRAFVVSDKGTAVVAMSKVSTPLGLPDKPSIAVLPFHNMSGDPEQEYFADGIVEDIITALSRFKSLFVIARNSSFTYKGRAVDIKQVGRELGVRYVLEGSVRKAARRVRITGQLIDATNGSHLWADKFDGTWDDKPDGEIKDIFELQDGLVTRVIGAIAPRLEQAEIERTKQKPTDSLDAYELYLRGLSSWNRQTKIDNAEAIRFFYASIAHDPEFTTPYGLALACNIMGRSNQWSKEFDKTEIARLIRRAGDIGIDDPIALCWAGHALAVFFGEIDQAVSLVTRATELDTNLAVAWVRCGWVFVFAGEVDRAIESLNRAIRLNPLDPHIFLTYSAMAFAHFFGRKEKEAADWAIKALRVKPDWPPALRALAASNALLGVEDDARKAIATLYNVAPDERISKGLFSFVKRQQDREHYLNAMRKAGLRE